MFALVAPKSNVLSHPGFLFPSVYHILIVNIRVQSVRQRGISELSWASFSSLQSNQDPSCVNSSCKLLSPFLFLQSHSSYSRSDLHYFLLKTNPATSELISVPLSSLLFSLYILHIPLPNRPHYLIFLYTVFQGEFIYSLGLKYHNFANES